jgi:hypothetical protein
MQGFSILGSIFFRLQADQPPRRRPSQSAPLAAVRADGPERFIGRRAGTLSAGPRATGARKALNKSILDVSAPATGKTWWERSFAARSSPGTAGLRRHDHRPPQPGYKFPMAHTISGLPPPIQADAGQAQRPHRNRLEP